MTEKETGDGRDSIGGIGMDANNEQAELAGIDEEPLCPRPCDNAIQSKKMAECILDGECGCTVAGHAYAKSTIAAAPTPPSAHDQQSVLEHIGWTYVCEDDGSRGFTCFLERPLSPAITPEGTVDLLEIEPIYVKRTEALSASPLLDKNDRAEGELLSDIRALCMLICNSPADTTIKGKIESLAFYIGHHPDILNADEPQPPQLDSDELVEIRKDAERYRWLCLHSIYPSPSLWDGGVGFVTKAFEHKFGQFSKAELDEAIDIRIEAIDAALSQYDKKEGSK